MTELQTRDFQIREFNPDERTVVGLAAPYGQTVNVGTYQERFEPGAFNGSENVKLFYAHDEPIGRIVSSEDTDEGYLVTAKISETQRGNDVYTLLRDEVLCNFSVGFIPGEHRTEDGVVVRTKVDLKEVSIVPIPAYSGATISEVRASDNNNEKEDSGNTESVNTMSEATYDDTEVRGSIENLERRFAVLEDGGAAASNAETLNYRSYGEFVKGLEDGSSRDDVKTLNRAFTGATTGDNAGQQPAWVNRQVKLVEENRNIFNLFNKGTLPATGMTFSYPVFASKTGDVGKQATEGADLNYLELVTGTASAVVDTYGGYSSLSRQVIERNDAAYLSRVLDMQSLSYAKVTNGIVRTQLTAATGTNTHTALAAGNTTAAAWLAAAVDSVQKIGANSLGLEAEVWVVSPEQFGKLASVVDSSGRPVFVINGDGSNSIGNVNVRGLSASVAGIPVVVDSKLTGNFSYVVSSKALTVMESAGAPFRLQDENIINLTKDFSLYGYLATTLDDNKAIVKVTTLA